MLRHRLAVPAVAVLAALAGAVPAQAAAPPAPAAVAAPKVLKFGQSARITGDRGNPLRIAPVGVYYHRPTSPHFAKPRSTWFVAIALKVAALSKADRMPPPVSGSQWRIKTGGRTFTVFSGNASSAPWVGRTDGQEVTVHPGSPEVIYYSFDLPKAGGTLEWSTPNGVMRWQIPTRTSGKAAVIRPVLDAIADYEGR